MIQNLSEARRPLIVSVVAIFTFLLGSSGFALALIGLGVFSQLSRIQVFPTSIGFYLYALLSGLVLFPLLILAGYNMWKMKKWAFVGLGIVYINCYDAWLLECGLAWCPEVSALFQIEL